MRRAAGLTAAGLLLLLLASGTAPAQQPAGPDVRLVLTHLSGVVGDGAPGDDGADLELRALVENRGGTPVSDLTLLVEVFDAASSRSVLHHAVDDGNPSGFLEGESVAIRAGAAIDPGEVVAVAPRIPADRIGWHQETGVHPIRISVLQGRTALDEIETAVVVLAEEPDTALNTVLGWPLDAPPWRNPDGSFPREAPPDIREGGRLERLVAAIAGEDAAVQPLVAAHVVEDLAAMADGYRLPGGQRLDADADGPQAAAALLERLRAAVADAGGQPVAGPYADADIGALLGAGLRTEALQELTEGHRRLEEVLRGRPLPDALWATTQVTPEALRDVLAPSRIRTLVLDWGQFAASDDGMPQATPDAVQVLRTSGIQVAAVTGDPWTRRLLEDLADPHRRVAAVQRVVAETAMVYLEYPFDAGRGLVLLPPPAWDPDPRAAADLVAAVGGAPWLRLTAVDDLVATHEPRRGPAALRDASGAALPPDFAGDLTEARQGLVALQAALPGDVAGTADRTWEELEQTLMRAPSTWWLERSVLAAQEHVAAVTDVVAQGFGPVSLPTDARITLTDTEGVIPVTVARTEGPPLRVEVVLDAPPRLEFPDGGSRGVVLEAGSSRTISFPAVAHASGRIPVSVRVVSAGAADVPPVELAEATLVVQSTALSGTALGVLGGVLAVLFAWWLYRRVRPRRPQLDVVDSSAPLP